DFTVTLVDVRSDSKGIVVNVTVVNTSETRKHKYARWFDIAGGGLAKAQDEFGNDYNLAPDVDIAGNIIVGDQNDPIEMHPGSSITDVARFQFPIAKAG